MSSTPSLHTADAQSFQSQLALVNEAIATRTAALSSLPTTSTPELISHALKTIPGELPEEGLGLEATTKLLLETVCPALAGGQAGPRYYGLVVGGVLPAAHIAENLVASYDACVQVHVPEETISVALERIALSHLLSLLSLPASRFTHKTFTTGATASNILGLSLGRDHVISHIKGSNWSVPEDGMGGVEVDVFVAASHASASKAASFCGIGRKNVVDLVDVESVEPCDFKLGELERRLRENKEKGRGSIVVLSAGEVNTGGWTGDAPKIRELCDEYNAWLHIDAAFAAFAVLIPEFAHWASDLALADSITSDAHKWLNVPYDCGLFFSRTSGLLNLCGPGANAPAYLTTNVSTEPSKYPAIDPFRTVPPPLFMNVENSRRFRALPVYASLLSLGRTGFASLISSNITFARQVESFMRQHPSYDLLTPPSSPSTRHRTLNIIIFAPSTSAPQRYQGEDGANKLKAAINESREVYCTGSKWRGRGAIRIAVSNWMTEWERDGSVLVRVLEKVMREE